LQIKLLTNPSQDDLGTAVANQIAHEIHKWLDAHGDPPGAGAAFIPTTKGDLVSIDDLIEVRKALGGSANATWKVKLKDGSDHLVKTESMVSKINARLCGVGEQNRWEVAAYRIDRLMGLDMIPETHLVLHQGKEFIQQAWSQGEIAANLDKKHAVRNTEAFQRGVDDMKAFDFMIKNVDRHDGNWLVDTKTGKIVLIDNGMAGAAFRRPGRSGGKPKRVTRSFLEKAKRLNMDDLKKALFTVLKPEAMAKLLERRDELVHAAETGAIEVVG
jgi:hypothetical protein